MRTQIAGRLYGAEDAAIETAPFWLALKRRPNPVTVGLRWHLGGGGE